MQASAAPSPFADAALVEALRRGDEAAFSALVDAYHGSLVRIAQMYVRSRDVAEEVAQETWVALIEGLDRFEGRSTIKTWLFRVLANRAKSRGEREGRYVPFAAAGAAEDDGGGPAVDPDRFLPPGHARWPGHWARPPRRWDDSPVARLESEELRARVLEAMEALPASQREVMHLRDVESWSAEEVCAALGITDGNQRILLHRARSKVRAALERWIDGEGER